MVLFVIGYLVFLCEVFFNFVYNVICYMLVGGCIIVCVMVEGDVVLVCVDDIGLGMNVDECVYVF